MIEELSEIELDLLKKISVIEEIEKGAFNIRRNGELLKKCNDKGVVINSKTDCSGIDIIVEENAKNKVLNIPVIVSNSGLNDLVYNDFYIGDNSSVVIKAGCAVHNEGNHKTGHSGIHRFYIGKNAKVSYIEKHYACGKGSGKKILNPTTEVVLEENATFKMETTQYSGVSKSDRVTNALLKDNSTLIIRENIITQNSEITKTSFNVKLEENSSCHLVSRSVAKDNSYQEFISNLEGNKKSYAHSECDAILQGNARVTAIPKVVANHYEARLIHEATIGKIAGEQLLKLMSLGLNEEEATNIIINGFLK
ncbi:MAG: SufD family Fe-S cluster assembly protein [Mycoplasmatota bacterium]